MFTRVPLFVAILSASPRYQSGFFISPVCVSVSARLISASSYQWETFTESLKTVETNWNVWQDNKTYNKTSSTFWKAKNLKILKDKQMSQLTDCVCYNWIEIFKICIVTSRLIALWYTNCCWFEHKDLKEYFWHFLGDKLVHFFCWEMRKLTQLFGNLNMKLQPRHKLVQHITSVKRWIVVFTH